MLRKKQDFTQEKDILRCCRYVGFILSCILKHRCREVFQSGKGKVKSDWQAHFSLYKAQACQVME